MYEIYLLYFIHESSFLFFENNHMLEEMMKNVITICLMLAANMGVLWLGGYDFNYIPRGIEVVAIVCIMMFLNVLVYQMIKMNSYLNDKNKEGK